MLRRGDIVIGKLDDYYNVKVLLLVEFIRGDCWWVRNIGDASLPHLGVNKYTLTKWCARLKYYKVPIEALPKEKQDEIRKFIEEYMERDLA